MAKATWERARQFIGRYTPGPEVFAPLTTGQNEDGTRFELTTESFGDNELVFDNALAVAAGAALGTPVDVDVPIPARLDPQARYAVMAFNPGAVAVTVRLHNREFLNGADQFSPVAQFGAAAEAVSATQVVQGLFMGSGASRVRVTNDAAVPAGGGFSVFVRIRRL